MDTVLGGVGGGSVPGSKGRRRASPSGLFGRYRWLPRCHASAAPCVCVCMYVCLCVCLYKYSGGDAQVREGILRQVTLQQPWPSGHLEFQARPSRKSS